MAEKTTCAGLNCRFICYCTHYHLYDARWEGRCPVQEHLITLAKAQEEDNRKGGRYHG